jgi:Transposase DDE domain
MVDMTKVSLAHEDDWQAVLAQLPSSYEKLAVEHKQLETQYGNAKLTTASWLLRFILLHVGANLPLRQTVALMAEAGGPSLSAMRLHKKMRRAAPYLRALVERMVSWTSAAKAELWGGYSMVLIDATTVCGPGAVGPDARIHTKLRVADVAVLDATVTDASGGETFKRFLFEPGELAVADRLYCNPVNVTLAVEQGAEVLVRYNRGSLPLSSAAGALDALATVRAMRNDAVLDLPVSFEHDDRVVRGRFIATRLPPEQAEQARHRLRKKEGATKVSSDALEAAAYVMLFTTVPRDRMSATRCLEAYRLRWQIELQFKRWKSLCGFDRLPNYRDDTVVAWLYAKLLLGILLDRMSSIRGELSPPVQLMPVDRPPRKPRRRRTVAPHGQAAVEAHEHPLPVGACGTASTLSA